jgi:chaperone required for assembly of F1-ATPase
VKRFWDTASVAEGEGGYRVLLDGRPMRLPGGGALSVVSAPLARALAAEWQAAGGAKGGEMTFADTPLTRLAGTAQERIAANMAANVDTLATYGESDLLCYRAERPRMLVERQAREWQPWLDWAARDLDAALLVTSGITHVSQPQAALRALHRAVAGYDANVLAGLGIAVPALGSLVLGLALAGGHLDGTAAHALSALDELFQEEEWGVDAEAAARRANVGADIVLAARFMALAQAQGAA